MFIITEIHVLYGNHICRYSPHDQELPTGSGPRLIALPGKLGQVILIREVYIFYGDPIVREQEMYSQPINLDRLIDLQSLAIDRT